MSQDYIPEPGVLRYRHDPGCEFFLPSGSCDCHNAVLVDKFGNERIPASGDKVEGIDFTIDPGQHLLDQAAKAAEWLVLCPRDANTLTLQPDGTERCVECGWHTGDPLIEPAVIEAAAERRREWRETFLTASSVMFGIALLFVGIATFSALLLSLAAFFCGLPMAVRSVRGYLTTHQPGDYPSRSGSLYKTGGGVHGRGKAPKHPPPPAARAPQPRSGRICRDCRKPGAYEHIGICDQCNQKRAERAASRITVCGLCSRPTLSPTGTCPDCEKHYSDAAPIMRTATDSVTASDSVSRSISQFSRQIETSFGVPSHLLAPLPQTALPAYHLTHAITASATTLELTEDPGWDRHDGVERLVEVVVDPGMSQYERILVRPAGRTLHVEQRGYGDSIARCHVAGAEVRAARS